MNSHATQTAEIPRPILPPVPLEQVTDVELSRYAGLIYNLTGVRVPPQKKTLLSNRLRRRLRETGIPSFAAYYEHLRRLKPDHPEWDAFLQEITTHETYLFRDEAQWLWFREGYLPQLAAAAHSGLRPRRLRVWSAACSTGDEAFTAACCIAAALPGFQQWQVRILGTDIGVAAVEQASRGTFGERAMRRVPDSFRRRFFGPSPQGDSWKAKPVLGQMTAFRRHNLMERLPETPFDVVFLKNVLIYFDRDSKRRVLENVRASICPGGLLVAGPADGVADLVRDYIRRQSWLFQRPQE